jgi:dipeptidyl aminopeptidase/acylaminoacyl peptidase
MTALLRMSIVLLALAVAAPPAQAAFPGRNGAVGYAISSFSGDQAPQVEVTGLASRVFQREQEAEIIRCERTDGAPTGGDCTTSEFGSPSYAPGGRRLLFDAGRQLGLIGAGGAGLTLFPAVTTNDGDPAFSPDGRRIVFTGVNDRGGTDVFVYALGSQFARMIVQDAGEPAWSSRNQIAWVRNGNIYVSNAKGGQRRWLTSGVSPDWSPGAARLVFVRPSPNLTFEGIQGRMLTIGARGRGLKPVFPAVRDALTPVWSPNGRWLAFTRAESGIFAKRLDGRGRAVEVATSQRGSEGAFVASFQPSWQPRPR